MNKRRGSFREKSKPLISLKTLSDQGTIVISRIEHRTADPIPDTWIMIKPGDLLISKSGTLRLVLKKNWQEGEVESLRITCDHRDEKLQASLEVEKMEIDSSNFEHLTGVLRPIFSSDISPHEYRPEFFTRSVRYNILTFLGFGAIGGEIFEKIPFRINKRAPEEVRLTFLVDGANHIINGILDEDNPLNNQNKINTLQIGIIWRKDESAERYQICEFSYPPGTSATTLETITLSCEVANIFGLTNISSQIA